MEPGVFSPDDTLERGHGSCRDFAWLMVQLTRRLGFGARFVSGYSIQLKADVKALDGARRASREDVTDLHAWAEIFLPGAGWIGFDATSGLLCAEGHLPLACTADPDSAAPVSGIYAPFGDREHDPASTKFDRRDERHAHRRAPARHQAVHARRPGRRSIALGATIDGALNGSDVRLSMGGEPTFVSIDDPDGAEWNTAALGRGQAPAGGQALRAHAGALLAGQPAALRPGEVVPGRAAAALGADPLLPQGRHADLAAARAVRRKSRRRTRATPPHPDAPRALIRTIAQLVGVDADRSCRRTRTASTTLWKERRLPVNTSLSDLRLDDAQERARLARVFEQGLTSVVGYVLPIEHVELRRTRATAGAPASGRCASERLLLIPGDSPLGYRLPLDGLPWISAEMRQQIHEIDPFGAAAAAGGAACCSSRARARPKCRASSRSAIRAASGDGTDGDPSAATARPQPNWNSIVRTALCVEVRDGMLHVFMPPIGQHRGLPGAGRRRSRRRRARTTRRCAIEGYAPPRDHRHRPVRGHARSRRHRGQHPPGAELERAVRQHDAALRRGAAQRASAPRSS